MADVIYEAATVFFSVVVGLWVLWSLSMTLWQRLTHAALAGVISACATIVIMLIAI